MISPAVIAEAAAYRQAFQAAQPFKHLCIDDFFTTEAAEAALRDFPPFDREFAVNSPMPAPETAEGGVYCDEGCHQIKPKYGIPRTTKNPPASGTSRKKAEAAIHFK